ncbi:hypothetical protein [Pontibacillus yanchengensis]|uniref:Uncharacterized protein n=1 Tax=Pontibacillus yanchengensis Y32 TaxID=1385514 RepID=A0A0A2TG93_9BACI|nr:hypothetical protein [Pontibacillus yanchengensis]KGP73453.1 hypothetical protein N782_05350 [Pontibacillus yanchengensis Y32]
MEGMGLSILIYLVGLFILYIVIETAVRRGINSSIIGRYMEEKNDNREDKESFLDDDLDKD